MKTLDSIDKLVEIISRLPSIGEKSALRLAIYLFNSEKEYLDEFAHTLQSLHQNIMLCKNCFALSEKEICPICENDKRDKSTICVTENYVDMLAIERTDEYNGLFHVLGNLISPLKGIGISDIKLSELIERSKNTDIKEIIMAFAASLEADTTSSFMYRRLRDAGFTGEITRITYGLSLGSDIENADTRSLAKSISNRIEMS